MVKRHKLFYFYFIFLPPSDIHLTIFTTLMTTSTMSVPLLLNPSMVIPLPPLFFFFFLIN